MADNLRAVAKAMVAPGKGILAADESTSTIQKRFDKIGVENVESNRQAYRDLLFTSKDLGSTISGVILFDETIRQSSADGTPFPVLLAKQGVLPGIKVDSGAKPLPLCPGETITEGLDGLPKRCEEYAKLGAKFAKWRAVITIGDGIPSDTCIQTNAHALARYAAICQENGIVPIVEPEVLMDGSHTIDRCEEVTERVLRVTFAELAAQRVLLEGMVLKPSMVVAGSECPKQASVQEVAERTIKVLKRTVPAAVPGIAFLSGGQSDELATAHLDAMNKIGGLPWHLTYSYGRALQAAAQKAWSGKKENVAASQAAFSHRAKMNSLASLGKYDASLEKASA
jgi:fructose-bisphosphate aldolase class I